MSCEKIEEIDLGAFLVERRESQWQEFRNHYAGCEDCSREVANWTRLEQALYATSSSEAHPAEETLLGLTTLSLAPAERGAVELHLESCAPCQSEVSVLRSFDFSAVMAAEASPEAASEPGFLERSLESFARWRESVAGTGLQPALMAAAVVLLALPIGFQLWQDGEAPANTAPVIAQEEPVVAEPAPVVPLEIPSEEIQVAQEPVAAEPDVPAMPVLELAVIDAPPALEAIPPVPAPAMPKMEIAFAEPSLDIDALAAAESSEAAGSADESGLVLAEGETILIAALLPGDLPVYGAAGMIGMGGPSVRTGGFVRSVGQGGPSIEVLSPDHLGWTSRSDPTLYWRVSEDTGMDIEIVISDDNSPEPLLEARLAGTHAAGIHALSLASRGLELSPDTIYRWSVALVVDEERRSKDRFAGSALLYRPASEGAAAELAAAPAGHLAHRYAAQGYWYDAFDQLTLWLEADPRDARLREHRAALLEQVGLGSESVSE